MDMFRRGQQSQQVPFYSSFWNAGHYKLVNGGSLLERRVWMPIFGEGIFVLAK